MARQSSELETGVLMLGTNNFMVTDSSAVANNTPAALEAVMQMRRGSAEEESTAERQIQTMLMNQHA